MTKTKNKKIAVVVDIKAKYILLQPGDATKYEFIISENPKFAGGKDFLFISSGDNSPEFRGYLLKKESVNAFFERVGSPPDDKEEYRGWAKRKIVMNDPYLNYVISHTYSNPYTAVAGIICAYIFLGGDLEKIKKN